MCANAEATLAETLKWMDYTYNDHRIEGGVTGHGNWGPFAETELTLIATEKFKYNGCDIEQNIFSYSKRFNKRGQMGFVNSITQANFNLKDIDLNTIKTTLFTSVYGKDGKPGAKIQCFPELGHNCNFAELDFQTVNKEPIIKITEKSALGDNLQDYDTIENKNTYYSYFFIDDIEYSMRFEKAFKNAVKLCGGKASVF